MFYGRLHDVSKMAMMTRKWEQKKDSGNLMQKEARPLTAEERQLENLKEQAESSREAGKISSIYNKIMSGEDLSPQEEEKLRGHDPKMYMEYKADQMKRQIYEEKLKNCRTKEEAEMLHAQKIQGNFSKLQSTMNDPHITKEEKLKVARRMQGDTLASARIFSEFKQSDKYKELPTEEELIKAEKAEKEEKETPETAEKPEANVDAEMSTETEMQIISEKSVGPKDKPHEISVEDMKMIMQMQSIVKLEIGDDTGLNMDVKA